MGNWGSISPLTSGLVGPQLITDDFVPHLADWQSPMGIADFTVEEWKSMEQAVRSLSYRLRKKITQDEKKTPPG